MSDTPHGRGPPGDQAQGGAPHPAAAGARGGRRLGAGLGLHGAALRAHAVGQVPLRGVRCQKAGAGGGRVLAPAAALLWPCSAQSGGRDRGAWTQPCSRPRPLSALPCSRDIDRLAGCGPAARRPGAAAPPPVAGFSRGLDEAIPRRLQLPSRCLDRVYASYELSALRVWQQAPAGDARGGCAAVRRSRAGMKAWPAARAIRAWNQSFVPSMPPQCDAAAALSVLLSPASCTTRPTHAQRRPSGGAHAGLCENAAPQTPDAGPNAPRPAPWHLLHGCGRHCGCTASAVNPSTKRPLARGSSAHQPP